MDNVQRHESRPGAEATVGKNAQGKKRVEAGTVLMYATYKYAEAPTKEMAAEYLAIIVCLLTRCSVSPATESKHDYLRFITLDAWPMARAEAELVGDNNADAPWCRRTRLFQVLLEQGGSFRSWRCLMRCAFSCSTAARSTICGSSRTRHAWRSSGPGASAGPGAGGAVGGHGLQRHGDL